jgi:hypothetical protein
VKLGINQGFKNSTYGYTDESKTMGNGSVILEFDTVELALKAVDRLNNLELDKKHTFKAFTLSEYEIIISTSDQFNAPRPLPQKVIL